MAKVKMTLEGFERTQKALAAAPEVARTHASTAVGQSTFSVAQRARAMVPVGETGTLKKSITSNKMTARSLVGRVGLDETAAQGYWYFVEYGTKYMAARPFFRPAAELEHNDFIRRMRDIGPKMEQDLAAGRFL